MAPSNGTAEKPATRKASSHVVPVVPVLPLSYVKRLPNQPATPSPSTQKVDEPSTRPASPDKKNSGDHDATTPSAATIHVATSTSSATASNSNTPDSSTICSEPTEQPFVSGAPPPPSSHHNPAFEQPARTPAPELPLPAPQPAIANRPVFHHPRPSNGSLVFAHHESDASSPVPHSGGYGFPPPGIVPYPPSAALPVTAVDAYGRPLLVSPTVDSYPPTVIKHHGPPTPHSYHGSQSSQIGDHIYNQHSTMSGTHPTMNGTHPTMNGTHPTMNGTHPTMSGAGPVNGGQGGIRGPQPTTNGVQPTINGSGPYHPTGGMSPEAAAALAHHMNSMSPYIRAALGDNSYSDCTLDVNVPVSHIFQDHPDCSRLNTAIRTPAHRLMLGRSPMLAEKIGEDGVQAGGVLKLEVRDEWIRPDVFWHCLRALYGWDIAASNLPSQLRYWSAKDELKTALSYWAAGQMLLCPRIRGIASDCARRLLGWETISIAAWFVSHNMALGPSLTHDVFLDSTLNWIIYHLPQSFDVDENAGDCGFSRLPRANQSASYRPNPPNAHVSSRVAANPRLSKIRFGDLAEEGFDVDQLYPGSPFTPAQVNGLFSRILLNLPFDLLKHVLEHPNLCSNAGPLPPGPRLRIIDAVRAAREKRRWELLESTDMQVRVYQERIASQPEPVSVVNLADFWHNSLGFKEETFIGDVPFLIRTWSLGPEGSDV
ncbi:Putative protein of unknown function [Podospora comata]|uniref:BTB domain-containing protein n=1 Tax=Podospora comata TaxID=48703 RepID=A0ABY6S9B4_PODCO|nr:Putative protein of unknown function [Podospora comata]